MALRSIVMNSREKCVVMSLISRYFEVISKHNTFDLIVQMFFTSDIPGQLCTRFSFKSLLLKITVPNSLVFCYWKESSIVAVDPSSNSI